MRFLIIGWAYLPESAGIGPYTADLAEYLVQSGHQVQVVTGFPMYPQWKIWEGYRGKWFMRETINGVPVLRTYTYVPSKPRKTLSRILFDMSLALSLFLGVLRTGPCDLIITISPPLQLGLTGWLASILKHAPFLFHIQDLVPDAAVATGMLSEKSKAVKLARLMERFIYRRADGIGVICEGFYRNLRAKGVPPEKLALLPNYIDLSFMKLCEKNNGFRHHHNLKAQDFVVMYSGTIALKQGLHVLVEVAAELREYEKIKFYLIGEGPYLEELRQQAEKLALTNITFLPLQPRESLPKQLAAADVLVITQRRAVTDIVFPGKLLYYMASDRPILAAVSADSETGRFVHEHDLGVVVPPESPKELAAAILELQQKNSLGGKGRRVAEEEFDRLIVLQKFAAYLQTLAKRKD
ncbi:MAG: glycosyltransferase family 4 protein [Chloroflexi bacterium]|nr:glycosyltransferase family 4 protein [Chloroflexota bacterium]